MKRFLIELIIVAAFVACVNLCGGCSSFTPSASQIDAIVASTLVSNQLDAAEAWLDAEIAATQAQLAALELAAGDGQDERPEDEEAVESDIPSGTKFLHTDVSGWPVTARLVSSVGGGKVSLAYDKADVWPGKTIDGGSCNANPWVFVDINGQWYAATWEWLRTGQTSKDMSGKSWGDHIKVSPLSGWEPTKGERVGLMVSGLARSSVRNVKERSNISWVV